MLKPFLQVATATAMLGFTAPASAATGIDCALDGLVPADRVRLSNQAFDAAAEEKAEAPPTPEQEAFLAKLAACTREHGWGEAASTWAARYSMLRLTLDAMTRKLQAGGIDAIRIEQYLETHAEIGSMDQAAGAELLAALRRAGIGFPDNAGEIVLIYAGTWVVAQQAREAFAAA